MVYRKKENKTSQNSVPVKNPLDNNNSTLKSYDNNNIGSGFFNSIIQGFAFGTGSQLASRTIDSVLGNKKIEIDNNNKCLKESELYLKCLENNEKNSCINFFDLLENCKKS